MNIIINYAAFGTNSLRTADVVHHLTNIRRCLRKLCTTWHMFTGISKYMESPAKPLLLMTRNTPEQIIALIPTEWVANCCVVYCIEVSPTTYQCTVPHTWSLTLGIWLLPCSMFGITAAT